MIHRFSSLGDKPDNTHIGHKSGVDGALPLFQMHDQNSADHALAGTLSDEIINISGAAVKVYPRVDSESYDQVYEEEPDPIYGAGRPFKAFFVPQPIAAQLTPFGVDAPNQTTVVFSRAHVEKEFGSRMIRIGDVIELPYSGAALRPDRYRVLNAFDSGNFRYNWLYWSCQVETLTDDITIDIDHK